MEKTELLIHLRTLNEDGTISSNGGCTFYAKQIDPTREDGYTISEAWCNDKDNYSRKIGRAIAIGRCDQLPESACYTKEEILDDLLADAKIVEDGRPKEFFENLVSKLA